jgi:hypothetical protein
MWLLPSRGRPNLVRRLFSEGHFQTPGLLIIDDDDYKTYRGIELPDGWEKISIPRVYLSPKLNAALTRKPLEPWYGILNDDHVPKTPGWDVKLVEALRNQPMVWPKDNYADRISTPVFDGDLVRSLGWIAPPELNHFYIDDAHEVIAEVLGCMRLEEVTVSHEHVNAGRMARDKTYEERPDVNRDAQAFQAWARDVWPQVRKRIEC